MTVKAEGRAARRSGARAGDGEQLSRADRVARGKDARAVAPLESHAEFAPDGSRDPVGLLLGQAKTPGAGAGADPAWADAGVAVHVLPGGGAADGGRPGRHADVGAAGAAVRGRAPVELRGVRLAGAAAGLRRQRLRRDAARPVRVGRQAAGGEPGGGRAGQRVPGQGPPQDRRWRRSRATARRCASSRSSRCWTSGTRTWTSSRPSASSGRRSRRRRFKAGRDDAGQGAHPRQHAGAGQADHRGRRAAADHRRPADDRPDRGAVRRRAGRRAVRASCAPCWASTGAPCSPTGGICSSSSRWSRWPARSSGSAASAPAPGSC